jgi:hypothetical protein
MDLQKCQALKKELAGQPEPYFVPIDRFFDGNDDLGSIGCNLDLDIDNFKQVLTGLLRRADVQSVFAQITDLNASEDLWPFTDTVFVVGTIPTEELQKAVSVLQPDEVGPAESFNIPATLTDHTDMPVQLIWWD